MSTESIADQIKFAYWVPNVSGGLVTSTIEQRTGWDYDYNVKLAQTAENNGFEYALSQVRYEASYGAEYQHESTSFSLALLLATQRLKVIAAIHPGLWHPAVLATLRAAVVQPRRHEVEHPHVVLGREREHVLGHEPRHGGRADVVEGHRPVPERVGDPRQVPGRLGRPRGVRVGERDDGLPLTAPPGGEVVGEGGQPLLPEPVDLRHELLGRHVLHPHPAGVEDESVLGVDLSAAAEDLGQLGLHRQVGARHDHADVAGRRCRHKTLVHA